LELNITSSLLLAMKAVVVAKQGASAEVHSDIEIPEPNNDQILVKCIYTAVNPLDAMMANFGLLVSSWPMVPGCDAAGIVVKTGVTAVNAFGGQFQVGDEAFGCTRIGIRGYSPWQEYVRMLACM
jgi:NADPH:quinone reductase-like Zn-dependent oxidoreductase